MDPQNTDCSQAVKIEYIWKIHEHLSENIKFADAKAGLLIIFISTLIGALHTTGNTKQLAIFSLSFRGIILLLTLMLMLTSIFFAVIVILPRLKTSVNTGIIFWVGILTHGKSDSYAEKMATVTEADLINQLSAQVFDLAEICNQKYKYVKYSLYCAVPSALAAAFIIVTI